MTTAISNAVRDSILQQLAADPLARLPLNGLVVWTELGRGLAGMLDRKGGSDALLRQTIEAWCTAERALEVDLTTLLPQMDPAQRLSREHLAALLASIQGAIEEHVAAVEEKGVNDGGRAPWMCAVKGWFPAGLAIFASLDSLRTASEQQRLGALRAWSRRYFPADMSGPKDLGVRAV